MSETILAFQFTRQNEIIATELAVIKENSKLNESGYKETYYLSQLDREMDRLILMVTILFAIFGLISILNFNARIGYIGNQQEKWKDEQENNYKSLKHDLVEFKIRFIANQINESIEEARGALNQENPNPILTIIQTFFTINHYLEIISLEKELEGGEPEVWIRRLSNMLDNTLRMLAHETKIRFQGGEATSFTNTLEKIRLLNNKKIEDSANELFNKMDFFPLVGDVTHIKL